LGGTLAGTQCTNHVVTLQCVFNVVRSDVERGHFPRIHPDAHGWFDAAVLHPLYVCDRGQLGHDIALNDVSHLAQWPVFRNADRKVEARIGTVGTTHLNKRILSAIGEFETNLT